jgi:hypothetical protein
MTSQEIGSMKSGRGFSSALAATCLIDARNDPPSSSSPRRRFFLGFFAALADASVFCGLAADLGRCAFATGALRFFAGADALAELSAAVLFQRRRNNRTSAGPIEGAGEEIRRDKNVELPRSSIDMVESAVLFVVLLRLDSARLEEGPVEV